ncbi:MAG: hypothetical protein COA58_13285 [Bacteroidetes bacterium]|nr:MAG: hypothetical protein COA58_13285 [Bacteroidota bacterium]
MSRIKHIGLLFCCMVWVAVQTFGQTGNDPLEAFTYSIETENFLDIKTNGTQFYDNLITRHGIEEVNTEGSPYGKFNKFIDKWDEILSPYDYDYYAYSQGVGPGSGSGGEEGAEGGEGEFPNLTTCPWDELGPVVITNDGPAVFQDGYYDGIGHTEFVRIAEFDPSKMLAGSIHGGLFYSSNSGQNWTCVSDEWGLGGCSWADFSEQNPGRILATVSNGQANVTGKASGMSQYGGVMISYDYGQSWDMLLSKNTISPYTRLNKVIFDPSGSGNNAYIAMSGGLFHYSNINNFDNSSSLVQLSSFEIPGVFENTQCLDIEVISDPSWFVSGNFIAVTVGGFKPNVPNSYSTKAFISFNGGGSFTEVFSNIPNKSACSFEISQSSIQNPFTAVIHFYAQGASSKFIKTLHLGTLAETTLGVISGLQNFGNCFAFAVNDFNSGRIVLEKGVGLYGTHDNFVTNSTAMFSNELHGDCEHFIWHPVNHNELWVATHGGVSKSIDGGVTWEHRSTGLGVANVNSFDDVSSNKNKILLAMEHNGSVRLENAYNQSNLNHYWTFFGGGDALGALIIENDDLNFYFTSSQSAYGTKYSTSYNTTASSLGFTSGYSFNAWFEPSTDRRSIYTPGGNTSVNNVYKSDLVSGQQPTRYVISDFANTPGCTSPFRTRRINASTTDKNVLFAGGYQDHPDGTDYFLMMNRDANNANINDVIGSWEEIIMPYDDPTNVVRNKIAFRDVVSSHYVEGRYYIATVGTGAVNSVVRSNSIFILQLNSGGTYSITNITGNFKNCIIGGKKDETIMVEKGTNEGVYVSTRCGVFYLHGDDINAQNYVWQKIGTGLPNVSKNGIKANYDLNKIRVGTNGRGLWEGCFVCPTDVSSTQSGVSTSKFIEVTSYIQSTAIVPDNRDVKYRGGTTVNLNPGFEAERGCEFSAFIHSCLPNGKNSFKSKQSGIYNPWEENGNSTLSNKEIVLDKSENGLGIDVYPNPTSDQLTFAIADLENNSATIQIFDMKGQMVKEWVTNFKDEKFVVSDLKSGAYNVVVVIGEKRLTTKIIKK